MSDTSIKIPVEERTSFRSDFPQHHSKPKTEEQSLKTLKEKSVSKASDSQPSCLSESRLQKNSAAHTTQEIFYHEPFLRKHLGNKFQPTER